MVLQETYTSELPPKPKEDDYWFIIRTKSRFEKKVHEQLQQLGYNAFLPLEKKYKIWSDRKKLVKTPLIPSMVFIQNPSINKELIYSIPGFVNFLKCNGEIGKVTPQEIKHLQILSTENLKFEKTEIHSFQAGEEVEIIGGPFIGLFAKAIKEKGSYRVLVEIPSIGIGYRVDIPKNIIHKLT